MKNLFLALLKEVYAASGQSYADSRRVDPLRNFNFEVQIFSETGNFAKVGFQKVSGLSGEVEVIEYREGGDNLTPTKMPGLVKFQPVTFERGMSEDDDMWNTFDSMFSRDFGGYARNQEPMERLTVHIYLKDRTGNWAKGWELQRAFCTKYETGEFDAEGNAVMIERMTVEHEGINKIL